MNRDWHGSETTLGWTWRLETAVALPALFAEGLDPTARSTTACSRPSSLWRQRAMVFRCGHPLGYGSRDPRTVHPPARRGRAGGRGRASAANGGSAGTSRIAGCQGPVGASASTQDETMNQVRYPAGWDEERVRRVLEHYETQSDEEAVAEDEAAYEATTHTAMEVPVELVPAVRELIAKRRA